jgi:5'-nucleotidase
VLVLVTNDDGIDAAGLAALATLAQDVGEAWMVAPAGPQSARSHAMTTTLPLRAVELQPRRFAVDGTPGDCVYLALNHLLPERPGLVLSGINAGENLGDDLHYSGTVAAALEAALAGIPALAVSLAIDWAAPTGTQRHWATAAGLAGELIPSLLAHPGACLNLNVPDVSAERVRGLRACPLGRRRFRPRVDERLDLYHRRYFWLGAEHEGFEPAEGTDGPLLRAGYATLTPIALDLTAHDQLEGLLSWPGVD